jgi:pimeloyl-ACP methyl ester carboxylesterase
MERLLSILCLSLFTASPGASQQAHDTWRDPSSHQVRSVTLDENVQLEVLDWGGNGRALVLLAGYLTAHAYDGFAPKLTEFAHVYGITRRGIGASSRPGHSGYTAKESGDDIVKVLDKLRLAAPVLAGHSFGGQDLTTVAANHPDRIRGVIYLNSAEDATLNPSDYNAKPPDPKRLPFGMRNSAPADKSSPAAYRAWQRRTHGVAFPESEIRLLYAVNPDGSLGEYQVAKSVRDALFAGLRSPDYARVRVPVLAFFAIPSEVEELVAKHQPATPEERVAIEEKRSFDLAIVKRNIDDLRRGVPNARVIQLPGANFYIFLSNEPELVQEMRSFIASLP